MTLTAIDAPPVEPPGYSLLGVARVIEDQATRWEPGFQFAPEQCGVSGRAAVMCGSTDALGATADDNPADVSMRPFSVWASDKCSAMSVRARDYEARARRQLAATQSFEIANELWTGTLRTAQSYPQHALADAGSDTVTAGAVSPVDALGLLEQGLGQCGEGRRGMMHVTPQTLVHLVQNGSLRMAGTTWVTPMGNLVVADAGYDGSAPNHVPATSGHVWAYATSVIAVRLGPVMLPGSPDREGQENGLAAVLDKSVNDVTVYAERMAGWLWDQCCHLAAEINLPLPLVGGAS